MSILLTRYSEPVLVLFSDYSRHKVHLLRFYNYSRIYTGRFATTSFSATPRRNLEQCCYHLNQCSNNVATLCCAKNRRCESSRATSPSKVFYVLIMKGNFSSFFLNYCTRYEHSGCLLTRTVATFGCLRNANALNGVFVITALKS